MKDLIPVTQNENGELLVSAKDLHKILKVEKAFSTWIQSQLENVDAIENKDFFPLKEESTGGRPSIDYALKIDIAKEICMVVGVAPRTNEETKKLSKQVRKYFIECERQLKENKPQLTKHDQAILNIINSRTDLEKALAIKDFEKVVTEPLHNEIKVLKPKAHYTDIILQNKGLIKVTSIAKDYGMSAQEFNKLLCDFKIQYRLGNQWFLYKKYQNKGYTHSETINYKHKDGRDDVSIITKWTQKGRLFLYEFLKEKDILPIIEKDLDLIR